MIYFPILLKAPAKIEYAIRDGISSGKSNQEIVQRIRGTKRLNFEDGLLTSSKSDIDRTVRTVRSHVANQAYLNSFTQIGFEYVRLVATLDGRTSKLCASLDGSVWKINDPAKLTIQQSVYRRCILIVEVSWYQSKRWSACR